MLLGKHKWQWTGGFGMGRTKLKWLDENKVWESMQDDQGENS